MLEITKKSSPRRDEVEETLRCAWDRRQYAPLLFNKFVGVGLVEKWQRMERVQDGCTRLIGRLYLANWRSSTASTNWFAVSRCSKGWTTVWVA